MSKTACIQENNKENLKDDVCLPDRSNGTAMSYFSRFLRFDSLTKKTVVEKEPLVTYYGVYIPCEIKKGPDEEKIHVYKEKSEALDLVKKYKLGRFKAFNSYQDAVSFALRGADVDNNEGNGNSLIGDKPYPFKSLSSQDLVALRKVIEAGVVSTVRDRVWDNPRYLVSSGNTPTILHEGCRYNALHVAAKSKNAEMCNLILTTVGDPKFVQTLYGSDADDDICQEFASILLDRYLNTPDKGTNDTPLHIACKFGAGDVVELITSFSQCDVDCVNKWGERAKDVICTRSKSDADQATVKQRIESSLQQRYYVPVLRCADESGPPAIGQVFTPAEPPELNKDPLSPQYEIRAFAGPMQVDDAMSFRKKWRTPPRSRIAPASFRVKELSKGLECVGRNLAEQMNIGWKEYWPFLDTFTDLRTDEGLNLLENYLKNKYDNACSLVLSETLDLQINDDISMSRISSSPVDSVLSPMSELCVAMKTCTLVERPYRKPTDPIRQKLCRQPFKQESPIPIVNHTVNNLLCIERTCQVFAKRIADSIVFSLSSEPEVAAESLKSELKHLQKTIFTYMEDNRFKEIDFTLIHSRLSQLIVFKLKQQKELNEMSELIEFLKKITPNDDLFSSDDERRSVVKNNLKYNTVLENHVRCLTSFLSDEFEVNDLKGPSVNDSECKQIWVKANKCSCDWNVSFDRKGPHYQSKNSRTYRKCRSILSTSPQSDSFVKRLSFDVDIGDSKSQYNETERSPLLNSPSGDGITKVFKVDMDKCQVVTADISEDDSPLSLSDNEEFVTASEYSDDDNTMEDASDHAVVEPFIHGEEPTKMDRLVFEAVSSCNITQEKYPYIYRWRHTVGLYKEDERERWTQNLNESINSPIKYSFSVGSSTPIKMRDSFGSPLVGSSTPKKDIAEGRGVPLQVSNWLRVTGPNSPKCALANKNVGHNASFGL